MLDVNSIGSAVIFLQGLMARGKVIEPVAGTPLAELASCCMSIMRTEERLGGTTEDIQLESICFNVVDSSNLYNQNIQTSSDHDVYMERAITMASDVMQRNLTVTRNKVQPMVRELVEAVELELQNFSNITFQTPIQTDKVYDVFSHPYVTDIVEAATENAYYGDLPFITGFPILDTEAIRDLIPSMNTDLDKRVSEVLESLGAEGLINLYTRTFVDGSISVTHSGRNEQIILLLITMNLLSTKPVSMTAQLDEFFDRLYVLKTQLALRIKNDLLRWKNAYEANSLIIAYPEGITGAQSTSSAPIIVHDELYTEWLSAGGDTDLIYGAYFSDRPLGGQEILNNRVKYQYEAKQYLEQLSSANESKRSAVIRRTLRSKLIELYETETKEEGSGLNETHRTAFNNILNDATTLELNDTLAFSTLLVCNSFYPETYAKKIIDGINHYQKLHPSTQVEDLATLVISDILVEWVVNLIMIKPIGAN